VTEQERSLAISTRPRPSQICLVVQCPMPCRKTKIYMWQFRSCAQFRWRGQAIMREESRLQNAGFKWYNLKLSCPEVLLTFFELLWK